MCNADTIGLKMTVRWYLGFPQSLFSWIGGFVSGDDMGKCAWRAQPSGKFHLLLHVSAM